MREKMMPLLPLAAKVLICILMLAFVWMPFPASGLTIRLYFGDFEGDHLEIYYTTYENPNMGSEQRFAATVDEENKLAIIRLSAELADHINLIRFDFPEIEQSISIRNISVSSAGIIQHNYNPCDFFSEANLFYTNDIPTINLIERQQTAYIRTGETDPFMLINSDLLYDMLQYRSSYRLTRLAACILLVLGYVIYRIRPFGARNETAGEKSKFFSKCCFVFH